MDEELKNKIEGILKEQKKGWKHLIYGCGGLYQSLKEAGIEGKRDTEKRFNDYCIAKHLNKSKISLDIGANTGFFSIYISKFLKSCTCVEINPYLTRIGIEVACFLNKSNINFVTSDFNDFKTKEKYDIVMSFASDEVADRITKLPFEQYIEKIIGLLKPDGVMFFESQAEDIIANKWEHKFNYIKEIFIIIFRKAIISTYPSNAPKREFLICVKKDKE